MTDMDWLCADCRTPVDRETTRTCPNCGHVVFYPLATDVPGGAEEGEIRTKAVDIDAATARLDDRREKGRRDPKCEGGAE